MIPNNLRCLSGSTLKIIAIVCMLIDHIAASFILYGILYPNAPIQADSPIMLIYLLYKAMRFIGRIAFPIFCFLLIEGFLHTSNRLRYALRLGAFCIISEIPFDLAFQQTLFDFSHQNVFFTLLIGFLVLCIYERRALYLHNPVLRRFLLLFLTAAGGYLAWVLNTDYDYKGIVLITILYFTRNSALLRTIYGCLCLLWEAPACLAFIPINLYNGKRGISLKYAFYWFYPVHLFLLALLLYVVSPSCF